MTAKLEEFWGERKPGFKGGYSVINFLGMITEKFQWMLKMRIDVYEADRSYVASVAALDCTVGMTGMVLTDQA
jgi:hypothetical protein